MKNIILLLFICLFMSCANAPIKEKSYIVTYEVIYPDKVRQFTIKTNEGKAKVIKYHSGFFHGGPMVYELIDKTYKDFAKEEYPIIIISQK